MICPKYLLTCPLIASRFSHNYNGIGAINITACNLVSAVGEYEVIITKDPPSVESSWTPDIIAMANNTQVNYEWQSQGYHFSTLGGIVMQAYNKWGSWSSFWTLQNGKAAGIGSKSSLCYRTIDLSLRALFGCDDISSPFAKPMLT